MLRTRCETIDHPGERISPMPPGVVMREADRDADCEGISLVVNSVESEPVTPAEVRQWFDHEPPGKISWRMVAVDGNGVLVGYSVVVHEAWRPAGDFFAWTAVRPEWQRRGVGKALTARVEEFLSTRSPSLVRSDVREANSGSLEFALARGFSIHKHICESVLDLQRFDESPLLCIRARLEAGGFGFSSMADLPAGTETASRVYELNRRICLEIPGEEEDASISFEEWVDLLLGAPWFRADGQLLCSFGGELVGLAAVQVFPEKKEAYNLVTGVLPEYRRRGVATALKLESARYAVAQGAVVLRTNNESCNTGIRAVNARMGYIPVPGRMMISRSGTAG
jgi:mycothiol synthase